MVHRILERYLARTRGLAEQAIFNFENSPRTKFANQLQTVALPKNVRNGKAMPDNMLNGAPVGIKLRTRMSLKSRCNCRLARAASQSASFGTRGVAGSNPATPTNT
jgi:hypothetical protein